MDENPTILQLILATYFVSARVTGGCRLPTHVQTMETCDYLRCQVCKCHMIEQDMKMFCERGINRELAMFYESFPSFSMYFAWFCGISPWFCGISHDFCCSMFHPTQDEDGWELRFDPVVAFLHRAPEMEAEVLRITHEQGAPAAETAPAAAAGFSGGKISAFLLEVCWLAWGFEVCNMLVECFGTWRWKENAVSISVEKFILVTRSSEASRSCDYVTPKQTPCSLGTVAIQVNHFGLFWINTVDFQQLSCAPKVGLVPDLEICI